MGLKNRPQVPSPTERVSKAYRLRFGATDWPTRAATRAAKAKIGRSDLQRKPRIAQNLEQIENPGSWACRLWDL